MNIKNKLEMLERIYNIHNDFISRHPYVCKKGCANCCTVNVTLTTIEGIKIIKYMDEYGHMDDSNIFYQMAKQKRYIPKMTTNKFGDLCLNRQNIPEEENQPEWGQCPFLSGNICSIYSVRPMGCRSMTSKSFCDENNFADMDPFIVTVNTIFLQFIEQLDIPGLYGNMADIIVFLKDETNLKSYIEQKEYKNTAGLLNNQSITMLLVPPEHRQKAIPVIEDIQRNNEKGKNLSG